MEDEDAPPEIGIRILLDEEIDQARAEAVQYVHLKAKALKLTPNDLLDGDPELLSREMQRQIVYKAIIDTDSVGADGCPVDPKSGPVPFFSAPMAVRQADSVFVETLFQLYTDHQDYVSPLLTAITQEDLNEVVSTLGKGLAAEAYLGLYDAPTLRRLLRTLASQFASAPTTK